MLLSIAIPVYNGSKTLEQTLLSVVNQSGSDYEIVISDNASTDNTQEIVGKYMAKYPYIKYFRNEVNLGPDRNYDLAIRRGEGDFSWLMGDDDIMMPGAVEKVKKMILTNPCVDYFFANCSIWRRDFSECLAEKFMPIENDIFCETADKLLSITGVNVAQTPTTVIRRSFWIEQPDTNYIGTNWHLLSKLFCTLPGHASYIIAEPLVQFRDASSATHKDGGFYKMVLVLLGIIEKLPAWGYQHETYLKVRKPLLRNLPLTICFEKIFGLNVSGELIRQTWQALYKNRLLFFLSLVLLLLPRQFYLFLRQIYRGFKMLKRFFSSSKKISAWAITATLLLVMPSRAYGYLDPGTGSYLLQLVIAAALGGLYILKNYYQKIKAFFKRLFSRKENKIN